MPPKKAPAATTRAAKAAATVKRGRPATPSPPAPAKKAAAKAARAETDADVTTAKRNTSKAHEADAATAAAAAAPSAANATPKTSKQQLDSHDGDDANKKGGAAKKEKKPKKGDGGDQAAEAEPKLTRKASSSAGPTEQALLEGTIPFVRRCADADFDPIKHIKFISWNVAGLRAQLSKCDDLAKLVEAEAPDVLCLQETKLSDWSGLETLGPLPGYTHADTISATKKGYSGCRTYVKRALDCVHSFGFNLKRPTEHDDEGRVLTTNVFNLAVVNSYVPNVGQNLDRLGYRTGTFDPTMRSHLRALDSAGANGRVVWTGDLNVAERDYDRYFATSFKAMQQCAGFTPEERASFRDTLARSGMVDAFRHLYPNSHKHFTFFSNRFVNNRALNNGWRLDYFVVSAALASKVVDCFTLPAYASSDHVPVVLWLAR